MSMSACRVSDTFSVHRRCRPRMIWEEWRSYRYGLLVNDQTGARIERHHFLGGKEWVVITGERKD